MALTIYQGKQYLFVNLGGTAEMISPLQLAGAFFMLSGQKMKKAVKQRRKFNEDEGNIANWENRIPNAWELTNKRSGLPKRMGRSRRLWTTSEKE